MCSPTNECVSASTTMEDCRNMMPSVCCIQKKNVPYFHFTYIVTYIVTQRLMLTQRDYMTPSLLGWYLKMAIDVHIFSLQAGLSTVEESLLLWHYLFILSISLVAALPRAVIEPPQQVLKIPSRGICRKTFRMTSGTAIDSANIGHFNFLSLTQQAIHFVWWT